MTANRKATIDFINDNLEWSDNRKIAKDLDVAETFVSRVRHNKGFSKRVLHALEVRAIANKRHALEIAEYHRKSVTL